MSRRYTPQQKARVIEQLTLSGGSVPYTSQVTGVPQRTIRDWRREHLSAVPPPQHPPSAAAEEELNPDEDPFQYVHDNIVKQVITISGSLNKSLHMMSPCHRVLALMALLDRLNRLQSSLPPPRAEHPRPVRIQRQCAQRTPLGRKPG